MVKNWLYLPFFFYRITEYLYNPSKSTGRKFNKQILYEYAREYM